MKQKLPRFLRNLFIILLAVLLIGPFLVPVPPLENTKPIETLAEVDSQFIEINDLTVHYKIYGESETVFILLHGFGASLFSWREIIQPLSAYGTVIAYDRPAFGLTERPMEWEGENPYSQASQIKLLIRLMDTLRIEKAILVGNSAGGTIAMLTALQHPERVEALILVDPAVYEGGGAPVWIRPLLKTPQMNHLGPLFARQIQTRGPEIVQMAWHDPSKITNEIMEGYTKPLQAENWDKALWYLTVSSRESELQNQLQNFDLPILIITGDDDRIVPTEQSIRLTSEIPNAQLVVIPQSGHVPHEEKPQEFMQAVINFLTQ
ncbi:MAG: alpha/beta hydrolase [Anaerolineales bacterium]|nr:alpha/beta hydrolase [Anaerolineales bacterium]